MDVKDFEDGIEDFKHKIGVRRIDVRGARSTLLEMVELWNVLGKDHLNGIVSVSALPGEDAIEGEVLGKKFWIRYSPLGLDGEGSIEASLTIRDLITGKPFEIGKFLVSKHSIFTVDGKEALKLHYHDSGYKSLVAIARRVMITPARA